MLLTPVLTSKTILMGAAVAETAAGAAAVALPSMELYDDGRLAAFCIMGSILGAFLAISVFTPDKDTEINLTRRLAMKFSASLILGLTMTPMLMEYRAITLTPSHVIAVATFVATIGTMAVHFGAPAVKGVVAAIVKSMSK